MLAEEPVVSADEGAREPDEVHGGEVADQNCAAVGLVISCASPKSSTAAASSYDPARGQGTRTGAGGRVGVRVAVGLRRRL